MEAIIRAEGVSKHYRVGILAKRVDALFDVSLHAMEGQIYGLVGHNGAGKSTLITIMLGLVQPTAGRVTILGRDPANPKSREGIGYLPEFPRIPPRLTCKEYLEFHHSLLGLGKNAPPLDVEGLLEQAGIAAARDTLVRDLSKGMTQRLSIAAALVGNPKVLILDEPQSGLDPMGRKEIRDLILRRRKEGATVFLCTHILPDIEAMADRVGLLSKGRMVLEGTPAELLASQQGDAMVTLALQTLSPAAAEAVKNHGGKINTGPSFHEVEIPSRSLEPFLALLKQENQVPLEIQRGEQSLETLLLKAMQS
ncbi:MAG: Vitamin B12 import ATP-binding protein BtuD [Myxococcota bacterium]|nr:Vitamin B12 import ATP-binding protein BtuD [Myxococcota bacterium]